MFWSESKSIDLLVAPRTPFLHSSKIIAAHASKASCVRSRLRNVIIIHDVNLDQQTSCRLPESRSIISQRLVCIRTKNNFKPAKRSTIVHYGNWMIGCYGFFFQLCNNMVLSSGALLRKVPPCKFPVFFF